MTRGEGRALRNPHAEAFSPDERQMAVGLYREMLLLQAATGEVLARWPVPNGVERMQGAVDGLAFSPDGRLLTSVDIAGGIWVWPVADLE